MSNSAPMITTWTAIASPAIALGALALSIVTFALSRRDTKNAAAGIKAERQAREGMAEALERIAAAAERQPTAAVNESERWGLENPNEHAFVLRNLANPVTGVTVDATRIGSMATNLPDRVDLGHLESHQVFLVPTFGTGPLPNELWVTTDQHSEPVAVPVRRWF